MKVRKKKSRSVEFVWNVKQLESYWYWINERMKIYNAKKAGKPWPWTQDEVLKEGYFTNVFRQLDKVTEAWTQRYAKLLSKGKNLKNSDILFYCCMFRLFNLPDTFDALYQGMSKQWNKQEAIAILKRRRDEEYEDIDGNVKKGRNLFTGAYMVTPGGGSDKVDTYCQVLDDLYDGRTKAEIADGEPTMRDELAMRIRGDYRGYAEPKKPSMERTVNILQSNMECVGAFVAYEIACDLRHTKLLQDAVDVMSWANPGPGAKRGLHRLLETKKMSPKDRESEGRHNWPRGAEPIDYVQAMRSLLMMAPKCVSPLVKNCEWPFEAREIEHSLCEFDKYMRIKSGDGRLKRLYHPSAKVQMDMLDDL